MSLTLTGTAARDDRLLRLTPVARAQVIQSQTIRFPTVIATAPVETTGDPRIEAEWFDDGLKAARKAGGEGEDSAGDERLPIAIETRYLADGETRNDRAIYDIGYDIAGKLLRGKVVTLRGLGFVERLSGSNVQSRLDSLWQARHVARGGAR